MQKSGRLALAGAVTVCLLFSYLQSQAGRGGSESASAELLPQEQEEFFKQRKQLQKLWRVRTQRNITPEVMKLTSHRLPAVRLIAARVLGRLEAVSALPVLERMRRAHSEPALLMYPAMAIGRIQARNLVGQRKVVRVAREVDLDWGGVKALFSRVNTDSSPTHPHGNAVRETKMVSEFMDIIGQSVKREGKISPWIRQLPLNFGQRLFLQASTKQPQEAAILLVNQLSLTDLVSQEGRRIGKSQPWLRSRLLDMNEAAVQKATRSRLAQMAAQPKTRFDKLGYLVLFEICESTNDKKAIPLLRKLEKHPDKDVARWASFKRHGIEANHRTFTSDFP